MLPKNTGGLPSRLSRELYLTKKNHHNQNHTNKQTNQTICNRNMFSSFCFSIVLWNLLYSKSKAQGLEEELISFTGATNLFTRLLGCHALSSHSKLQSSPSNTQSHFCILLQFQHYPWCFILLQLQEFFCHNKKDLVSVAFLIPLRFPWIALESN